MAASEGEVLGLSSPFYSLALWVVLLRFNQEEMP